VAVGAAADSSEQIVVGPRYGHSLVTLGFACAGNEELSMAAAAAKYSETLRAHDGDMPDDEEEPAASWPAGGEGLDRPGESEQLQLVLFGGSDDQAGNKPWRSLRDAAQCH
jgi:hypothetical protein